MSTAWRMSTAWGSTVVTLLGILTVGWGNASAQEATGSFERTLDVDGPVRLEVMTGSGRIAVEQGPVGHVQIAGLIRIGRTFGRSAEDAEALLQSLRASPPIEVIGDHVRVGAIDDPAYNRNVSISYSIVAPPDTALTSRSGSGSQALSGIEGGVDAATGSGSISLQDIGGAVKATAGSGSIAAEGVNGPFEARTGSGWIKLVQTGPGDVEVSAGSGNIDLSGINGALHSRSGSGSVRAEGEPKAEWNLEAGSGSIRLRLPADAAFDLNAQAGSGGIRTDHPVTQQGTISRNRLIGEIRGGGPLVRLRTGSGSIAIE